jgi:hypothetical protein
MLKVENVSFAILILNVEFGVVGVKNVSCQLRDDLVFFCLLIEFNSF